MISNRRTTVAMLAMLAITAMRLSAAHAVQCLTEPISDIEMSTAIAGTVAVIHHGEGTFVEAGTVVLELESRVEQLDLERKAVQVETLKAELARSETLLKSTSSISREEVDKKRGEFRVASIELELAKEALAKRRIAVPIAGIITLLPVEVGEYCQPPRILLRVVDSRQFYAVANVEPRSVTAVSLGNTVRLDVGSDEQQRFEGKVVFISPVVDPGSGLLRIKALFTNANGRLRPGVAGVLQFP
jgi:membrane fusion protein (multidrug efflux system)